MPSPHLTKTINRVAAMTLVTAVGVGFWGWIASRKISPTLGTLTESNTVRRPSGLAKSGPDAASQSSDKAILNSKLWTRNLQSGFRANRVDSVVENTNFIKPAPALPLPAPVLQLPDMGLRLVGTVIEKGRSMAIAIDRGGKLDFCREGTSLQLDPEGVRIESVFTDSVLVSFQGEKANWQMGQALRFSGTGIVGAKVDSLPSPATNSIQNKPKMSTADELDMINGDTPSVPL